jgi:hypothetical protein
MCKPILGQDIALGREMWNVVDVVVGIGLVISTFIKSKSEKS